MITFNAFLHDKKQLTRLVLLFSLLVLATFEPAFANSPFDAAEDKTQDLLDFLTGGFAALILTIVLVIVGLCLLKGWIQVGWAISIAVGAIIIGSAAHIAAWLIG